MVIHFIHPGLSYLPELVAYQDFLQSRGHHAVVHTHADTVPGEADVLWWMCGTIARATAARHARAWQIHEYASASVPPLAWMKDRLKAWQQPRPQHRIFQNAWVRNRMGFSDAVPYEYRDMGVSSTFLSARNLPRTQHHDFVYLGDMHRLARFLPLLDGLGRAGRSVLLIGEVTKPLERWLSNRPFVTIAGRVAHAEVAPLLTRARYGLNLVPDRKPYSHQTSTKLLEYCAAGLPVVSTDYAWVRDFERHTGARFFYVPESAASATYARLLGPSLDAAPPAAPSMVPSTWDRVLAGLDIWRHLGIQP